MPLAFIYSLHTATDDGTPRWRLSSPTKEYAPVTLQKALFNSFKNVKEDHKAKTWLLNSPDPDLIKEQKKKGHGDPTLHLT